MSFIDELLCDVQNPEMYNMSVDLYIHSHLTLCLRADYDDTTFFLTFSEVFFYECPMRWKGVNFRIGDPNEREEIIRRVGLNEYFPEHSRFVNIHDDSPINVAEFMQKRHKVYKVDTPNGQVRIFAATVSLGRNYLGEHFFQPLKNSSNESVF